MLPTNSPQLYIKLRWRTSSARDILRGTFAECACSICSDEQRCETIRQRLSDKLTVIGAEAGMHLVALLPRGVSDVEISLRATEMGISAMPLSSCYARPPLVGGLILGYGGTDARQIHDGIRRLAMCF